MKIRFVTLKKNLDFLFEVLLIFRSPLAFVDSMTQNCNKFRIEHSVNLSSALRGQLMAAKSLKTNFRKFFLKLINHKLNFVKCQSVSVMTGPPPSYCKQNYSGQRFYLLIIVYMTSMPQDFKKKFKLVGYFRFNGSF